MWHPELPEIKAEVVVVTLSGLTSDVIISGQTLKTPASLN